MKILLLAPAGAVLLGCAACGRQEQAASSAVSSQASVSSAPASSQAASAAGDSQSGGSPASQPESGPEADGNGVEELLESLMQNYQPGTAGSGMKLYQAAFQVLNYTEQYDEAHRQALEEAAAGYLDSLSGEELAALRQARQALEPAAEEILEKGAAGMQDILDSIGNPNQYETYSREKYQQAMAVIDGVLERYP